MPERVLTVGDGDLSYSIALLRAFGTQHVELTATTLPDADEVCTTYARAAEMIAELRDVHGVKVVHGVDATQLSPSLGLFDHICFCHPHLGLSDLLDEAAHAQRHSVLLAHFLHSASALLAPGGHIHLTLCGNQPTTWEVDAHAARLGLCIVQRTTTGHPKCFFSPGAQVFEQRPSEAGWSAARKFRSGALGSRHWCGKYGYEHRRCEGDDDMSVDGSVEIIFAAGALDVTDRASEFAAATEAATAASGGDLPRRCPVCAVAIASGASLDEHVRCLAIPTLTPTERAWRDEASGKSFRTEFALASYLRQQEHARLRQPASKEQTAAAAAAAAATAAASADAAAAAAAAVAGDSASGSDARFVRMRHVVPEQGTGQRAFAWTRRTAFGSQLTSKKVALTAFNEGRILLGGSPVEPTRVLQLGDVLELLHDSTAAGRAVAAGRPNAPFVVHAIQPELAVVYKPAACRACGDYPGTLHSAMRTLLPPSVAPSPPDAATPLPCPVPVSRIETSCTGLVLVARTARALGELNELLHDESMDHGVRHTFVALVHGRPPAEWSRKERTIVWLPPPPPKRPRGRRRTREVMEGKVAVKEEAAVTEGEQGAAEEVEGAEMEEEEEEEEAEGSMESGKSGAGAGVAAGSACAAAVSVLSETDACCPVPLTTLSLECSGRRGRLCGDLCYFLRSSDMPVVGDSYALRERQSLPRYCATLKKRPQISCLGVAAVKALEGSAAGGMSIDVAVKLEVPARLLAESWSTAETASRARLERCGEQDKD